MIVRQNHYKNLFLRYKNLSGLNLFVVTKNRLKLIKNKFGLTKKA